MGVDILPYRGCLQTSPAACPSVSSLSLPFVFVVQVNLSFSVYMNHLFLHLHTRNIKRSPVT